MSSPSGVTQRQPALEHPSLRDEAVTLAREAIYRFLGLTLRGPHEPIWSDGVRMADPRLLLQAALVAAEEQPEAVAAELAEGLQAAARALRERPKESLQAEYDRLFGLVLPKDCPPCETEYIRAADVFQRAQVMADVAGFYRAFGLKPARTAPERPDHVSLMCEFMATVLMKQRIAVADGREEQELLCVEAAGKFFAEHLSWWVPAFAHALSTKAKGGFFDAVAKALATWIAVERDRYGLANGAGEEVRPELIEPPEEAGGCLECPLLRRSEPPQHQGA